MLGKTPEQFGVSSPQVLKLVKELERCVEDLHSIAVTCDDEVLLLKCKAPYTEAVPQMLHSFAKSMNSLAVGIAMSEGRLREDDLVLDYFRDYLPAKYDRRLERLTVRNLLTMAASSCSYSTCFRGVTSSWITHYLTYECPFEPGTQFQYDTGASYMLSSLVRKTMGKTTFALLKERVFGPMGITNVSWLESPEGNTTGGWGLYMTTPDIAKIAILLANSGRWKGRQLVPEEYLRKAFSKQIDTPADSSSPYGYGYQFWVGREGSACVFGAFGNCIVFHPEKRIAVAVTAGASDRLGNPSAVIEVAANEDLIVPTVREKREENPGAARELADYLSGMSLPAVAGSGASPQEGSLFGRRILLGKNDRNYAALRFERAAEDEIRILFDLGSRAVEVNAGYGKWISCEAVFDDALHHAHSFSYAFTAPDVLEIKQYLLNTSAYDLYRLEFKDGKMAGVITTSVKLGGSVPVELTGIIEED